MPRSVTQGGWLDSPPLQTTKIERFPPNSSTQADINTNSNPDLKNNLNTVTNFSPNVG